MIGRPLSCQNINTIKTPLHFVIERSLTVTGRLVTSVTMKTGLTAMTYRDFGYGRAPARVPQHAAPSGVPAPSLFSGRPGPSVPFRHRTRRALRFVATAGMWAAGLCLVIGSLALVVAAATPGHPRHFTSAEQGLKLEHPSPGTLRAQGTDGSAAAGRRPDASPSSGTHDPTTASGSASHVLAMFTGRGSTITRHFQVSGSRGWAVHWSYACPARLNAGQFIVEDAEVVGRKTRVGSGLEKNGPSGSGTTWLRPGPRNHYLVVVSSCSWTMRVMEAV
jgi:hypothetical protein